MSIHNLGRESKLTPVKRKEAIALVFKRRNTYSKMLEDEAVEAIHGEQSV